MLVSIVSASTRTPAIARQPGGEAARVRVIVGEARAVVLERVQRGRAQDAGLAHAAAQHLAEAARAFDVVAAARDHRADRRAEALREADATPCRTAPPARARARRSRPRRSRCARRRGAAPARGARACATTAVDAARAARRGRRRGCACSRRRPAACAAGCDRRGSAAASTSSAVNVPSAPPTSANCTPAQAAPAPDS